jgi:diguanylate cyclase (GGDEF)-like protein
MNWNIDFDIAAFFIDLILYIVFVSYKNFATRQNKIYHLLLLFALASSITDILAAVAGNYWWGNLIIANYAMHLIHMVVQNAVPVIYCFFAHAMVYETGRLSTRRKLTILLPYCICVVCILISPFTGFMFSLKDNQYERGWGQIILYASAVYYIVLSCVVVIRHLPIVSRMQKVAVLFYTVENLIIFTIQIIFRQFLLQEMGIAFAVFFIYLTMQNPLEYMDVHTGTYNRNLFIKVIGGLLNGHSKFSVICVQIDGFGYINDKFGMSNGNILLRQISDFLVSLDRKNKVFHMVGTQFAIVVPDGRACNVWIDKIVNRFSKPFYLNNIEISLWAYLCCISYPDNVSTLNDVIDTIDYSLKQAKTNCQSYVVYGSADILAKKRREAEVEQAIIYAVQHKTFEVYYQPIYSVTDKKYTSAEALVRLRDKTLGFIPPDEFIPMAEKNGDILAIGEIVLEKVCIFIKEHHPEDFGIKRIHVNLSVVQCMQENITQRLFALLDKYNISQQLINFEITETTATNSGEHLLMMMRTMNKKGIRFSLDDYGTGYSNTANIMQYPYEVVKLDKSIVWAAQDNIKAAISLKYIIAMIKELDMTVLAEGVETQRQAKSLIDVGCEYFQGFFYSRPVDGASFIEIVENTKVLGETR